MGADAVGLAVHPASAILGVVLVLRILCSVLCIPVGGALLAKVYGIASMQTVVLWIALPCLVLLGLLTLPHRAGASRCRTALIVGILGGLVGTFGYDLMRIPFHLAGQRVFAPITAYGVWICDAGHSTRWTDLVGWTYHFACGMTFGIMYAMVLERRHWICAVGWGLLLETIIITSPFAGIFLLAGNYAAIGVAYLGHVAYGVPLGIIVQNSQGIVQWLETIPAAMKVGAVCICIAALIGPSLSPEARKMDQACVLHTFRIEDERLFPDWVRLEKVGQVAFSNAGETTETVHAQPAGTKLKLGPGESGELPLHRTGIHRVFVEPRERIRSHSSFVIVEPAEKQEKRQ